MPRVCCIKTCLYSKAKNCRNIKLPLFRLPRDSSSSKNDIKKNLSKRKDASETINKNRNHLPANSFTGLLSCCIPNCKNYNSKKRTRTKKVKYFTFPKDKTVLNAWLKACQKKLEDIKVKTDWICEEHFADDCFHYVLTKLSVEGKKPRRVKKLKHGSIPTLNLNLPKLRRNTIIETNSEINSDDQNVCSQKNEQFRCESPDDFHPSKFLQVIIRDSTSRSPDKSNAVLKKEAGSLERREELVLKSCFLCGCKQNIGMQHAIAMHKFPDDSQVNWSWRQACDLLEHDYMNTSALLVCSKHFMSRDYIRNSTDGSQILKPNAVPSVSIPNPVNTVSSVELNQQESGDDGSQTLKPDAVYSVSIPDLVNAVSSVELNPHESGDNGSKLLQPNAVSSVEVNLKESGDSFNDTQSVELVSNSEALKERDVHFVDNSSQTRASPQFVERSCQTEPVCILAYKDMDLHVTSHPAKRKRRLSFP
ncbi:hypothetical protein R5R35_009755 [Gryllus longicercus]|uniref:THAP-type domain-containing protein n=1 Tax=Gryllus longicercus TaxID=2509291 RepID=A0AAN9VS82_9ORTH